MKDNKKKCFYYTKENIKYPTYGNEEIDMKMKENIDNETLLSDIEESISLFKDIIKAYSEIIIKNKHNFTIYLIKFQKSAYNFVAILKCIEHLIVCIKYKLKSESFTASISPKILFDKSKKNEFHLLLNYEEDHNVTNESINSYIKEVNEFCENIRKTKHKPGIIILNSIFRYLNYILNCLICKIYMFNQITSKFEYGKEEENYKNMIVLYDLVSFLNGIKNFSHVLNNAFFNEENSILNKEEDSKEWQSFKRFFSRALPSDQELFKDILEKSKKQKYAFQSIIFLAMKRYYNVITKGIKCIDLSLRYSSNPELAEFDSKRCIFEKEKNFLREIFAALKEGGVKFLAERMFPSIDFREKVYLRKGKSQIDLNYIKKLLSYIYGEDKINEIMSKENKQIFNEEKIDYSLVHLPILVKKFKNKSNKKYYVKTFLLNYRDLDIKDPQGSSSFCCSISGIPALEIRENTIMIYIHGGGFIGGSTFIHEDVLRNWSKKFRIPIIGIDYRISPKYKYPEALDDIYQAYSWILENGAKYFGVKPRKIIISGDSAGATLALNLTFLLIAMNKYENKNIKLPDFQLLFYPCGETGLNHITNSLPLCFNDFFLDYNTLTYISQVYRGHYKNNLDPFLNPSQAPSSLFSFLPPSLIFPAAKDPLRDDTVIIASKAAAAGAWVKVIELFGLGHAFMNAKEEELTKYIQEIVEEEMEATIGRWKGEKKE